jgi:hypothetical protein
MFLKNIRAWLARRARRANRKPVYAGTLRQPNEYIAAADRPAAGSRQPGSLPCVALCGEFSAGKSSIINLLLGRDMLPTSVLPSTRRSAYLRYAPDLRIEAVSDGGGRERVSPETIGDPVREDVSHFDVGMPSELLRHVELIDTPGFADPFHDHQRTLDAVEGANVCIWCTLATQAWRESERQTWLSLPPHVRTNGILVVTHADTLAGSGEQQRVRARLGRETGGLFGDIVLLSVLDAMRAVRAGQIADPGLWQDSGGGALIAALERAVRDHRAARRAVSEETAETIETPWTGLGFGTGFQPAEPMITAAVPATDTLQEVRASAASNAPAGEAEAMPGPAAFPEPERRQEQARDVAQASGTFSKTTDRPA